MSTGLDLLQRLRKQQQQHVKQSQEKGERQSTTKDKNEDTQDVHKKTSTPSSTTIEVCLGPDCSGGGGGAALLEIEDLVSCREKTNTTTSTKSATYDINNKKKVVVIPGGCRDFCTMGPNVYVRNDVESIHYSKVNNPKKCRDIISSIYGKEEEEESTSVQITHINTKDSSVESLMRRREDSIRWQSHKDRAARERRLKVRGRNV